MSHTVSTQKDLHPFLPSLPENWDYLKIDQLIEYQGGTGYGLQGGIKRPKEHDKPISEGNPLYKK